MAPLLERTLSQKVTLDQFLDLDSQLLEPRATNGSLYSLEQVDSRRQDRERAITKYIKAKGYKPPHMPPNPRGGWVYEIREWIELYCVEDHDQASRHAALRDMDQAWDSKDFHARRHFARKILSSYNQDVFLGVPFAQPPVNELRFRVPQSLNSTFNSTISATSYAPECVGYGV